MVPWNVPLSSRIYGCWGVTSEKSWTWFVLKVHNGTSNDPDHLLTVWDSSVTYIVCHQKLGDFCVITMWGNNLVFGLSKISNSRVIYNPDAELSVSESLWNLRVCESTSLFIFSFWNPEETHISTFLIYLDFFKVWNGSEWNFKYLNC